MNTAKRKKPYPCHCSGWWFPHRKACKGCDFGPPQDETAERERLERIVINMHRATGETL